MAVITPINEAEAIFAPLFDEKIINMSEFELIEFGSQGGTFKKGWDVCSITSNAPKFILRWTGEIDMQGYDCLRIFLNLSKDVLLSGKASINGKKVPLFENIEAQNVPLEPTSPPLVKQNESAKLTSVELIFDKKPENTGEAIIVVSWLGLLASWKEHLLEEKLPKYDDKWDGFINPDGRAGILNNVLMKKEELEEIKNKLHEHKYRNELEIIANNARKYEDYSPEPEITEYLPCGVHLYRYVRVRDRGRQEWAKIVSDLAIAGYLCENEKWSRLAARIVLSIVHTPYWFEGPIFHFPGSDFHDVCFLEESHTSAVAKAMGFLGDILTPKANELILKKIEENWKWVDFKCSEPGYRWFMNQGIVGNYGRIMGAYYLYLATGKYGEFVEKAYADHSKMVDNYLTDEGHCVEGPAYYQYAFSSSMYLWVIYANYKNLSIEAVIPEKFKKSVKYTEAIMSSVNPLGQAIPVSNGQVSLYNQMLLMFMVLYCDYKDGKRFLKARMEGNEQNKSVLSVIDLLFFISFEKHKNTAEDSNTHNKKELIFFEKGGLLSYSLKNGKFLFLCERNPLTGHHHYDRGSFVLEANGKILFPDLGTTNYSNLKVMDMKKNEYHTTAYPLNDHMKVASSLGKKSAAMAGHNITEELTLDMLYTPEAKILYAKETENGVHIKADLAPLYSENVLCGIREAILEVSESSGSLCITDEWKFTSMDSLNLNFLSYGKWDIVENKAVCNVDSVKVKISFVEESGHELFLSTDETMTDYDGRFISVLRVRTGVVYVAKILTKIEYFA